VQALEPDPVGLDPVADAQIRATRLDEALKKLAGVRARHQPAAGNWDLRVEIGEPWDVIVRVAKETCSDLIVVGPHEHTRWGHCYVGSTAQRVVRLAHCPVMVVK
jgi:nucleotide-binding universal stress UspA family protein